jgi:hypothetical protein
VAVDHQAMWALAQQGSDRFAVSKQDGPDENRGQWPDPNRGGVRGVR